MERYLIESPHDPEDCRKILEQIAAAGYLHYFDWGCASGIHCGWAIVETVDLENAYQIVPWSIRKKSRIIKLNRFEDVDLSHTSGPGSA